jgi:hypothetical protein
MNNRNEITKVSGLCRGAGVTEAALMMVPMMLSMRGIRNYLFVYLFILGMNCSHAAIVASDFTVLVDTGSLAGNTYVGSFRYDDSTLTGIGYEYIGVFNGFFEFEFEWMGQLFREDSNPGLASRAEFIDGAFAGLAYFRGWDECCNNFSIFSGRVGNEIAPTLFGYESEIRPFEERVLDGTGSIVRYSAFPDFPVTIPIPAAIYLFGPGILGLVGIATRKKSA